MICKNCGKTLIRGYSFCMECGTPVPAEKDDDNEAQASQSGMTEDNGTPDKEGTLVFCPDCGMRMQKDPNKCEKCGMALSNSPNGKTPPSTPPDWGDPAGDNGKVSVGPSAEEIKKLTDQLAGFGAAAIPPIETIDAPKQSNKVRQKEPEKGKAHKVENFSMSEADAADEDMSPSGKEVPVIEGCSMDEDISKNVDLDPYKYLTASMDDSSGSLDMSDIQEPVKPAENTMPEPISPVVVSPASSGESISAAEKSKPNSDKTPEPITPQISAMESIAPVEKTKPNSDKTPEPITPVISAMESIAPGEKSKPNSDKAPEPVTPVISSMESIAPAEKSKPEPEKTIEPVTLSVPPIPAPSSVSSEEKTEPKSNSTEEKAAQSNGIDAAVAPIPPIDLTSDISKPTEAIAPISASTAPPAAEPKKPVRVAEMPPKKEKPKPEPEDFIPEEIGFISESGTAIREETQKPESKSGASTAVLAPPPSSKPNTQNTGTNGDPIIPPMRPEGEASKGNLVYCRNCGQDMYDTEKVCPKCGAPRVVEIQPVTPNNKKKSNKFIFAAIGTAAALAVVVALAVIISSRTNKPPIDPDIPTNSDPSVSCTMSDDNSEPVESDDVSEPVTSSVDENNSSEVTESAPVESSVQSAAISSSATQSTPKPQSSPKSQSTPKPQSSSTPKPQSSSKQPQSSTTPVVVRPSAKVQSLEADRAKIMDAAAQLSGEIGKVDALVKHANYALETSKFTKEATLENFYNEALAKAFLQSINNNRISMTILFDEARPVNSELNSLYSTLSDLKARYNDCCNFIASPGDARKFTANASTYISAFNSVLTQMGINKFYTSAYTSADKDRAYATVLKSSQTCITSSMTSFSNLLSTLAKLGNTRFDVSAENALGNNASTYIEAVTSYGKLNAYRLMLLGVTSGYSKNYANISSAYNEFTNSIDYNVKIADHSLVEYTSQINRSITTATSAVTSISSAISKAF